MSDPYDAVKKLPPASASGPPRKKSAAPGAGGKKRGKDATGKGKKSAPGEGAEVKRELRLHKAAHDPRAAALVALHAVLEGATDSQAALDAILASPELVPTDKRLCTELLYGVLRQHICLDWFLKRFLSRPDKLPGEMLLTLEIALYEMAFLRTPDHASVNRAVAHISNRFGKNMGGVANGVLRAVQRDIGAIRDPALYAASFADADEALACRYAMPAWIVKLWLAHYGKEATMSLLEACGRPAPSGLRFNRAHKGWEHLRHNMLQEHPDALPIGENALVFPGGPPWQSRTLAHEGKASRQSGASFQALQAFEPASWTGPVWDCCAGRGGKTMALLEQGVAVALASDPSRRRLSVLPEEYARLGLSDPPLPVVRLMSAADAGKGYGTALPSREGEPDPLLPERFGTILVDAPCSGLGTLSRRPEIRLRRAPEDITGLAALQLAILTAVWPRLAPGGTLVYLTCTVSPEENEHLIRAFTAAHKDASVGKEFRTPHDSPLGEFFYGAQLRKEE